MPRVPVAETRVGIAAISDAKLQPAETGAGGLGRGLIAVGQGLGQYAETLHQMDLDAQSADFAAKSAQARLAIDKARTDARATAGAGATGYTESMDKLVTETYAPILEGIKDRRLRNHASQQIQAYRAEVIGNDYGWEVGKRTEKTKTDTLDAIDMSSARVRTSPDGTAYTTEKKRNDDLINSAPLPEEVKAALRKHSDGTLAGAAIESGIDSDPNAIAASIKRGDWNGVLDGKALDNYSAQADVAIRRIDAAKEHQAALAKAQLSERISTVKAQLSAGIKVDDAQLAGLADQAAAVGDTSGAFDLNEARVRNNFNTETKGWTPQQYEAERNRLRAKGDKIKPQDAIRLDQLEKRMPSAVSDYEKDPGAWASSNGVPPPQLNWNDPGSIDARRRWAATVSRASGRPTPFFSPAEQSDLRAQAEGGPTNELGVINKVAMIGGRAAVTEMQRILPNDPKAARLVTLNQFDRGTAMNGIKLLAENPALLPDKTSRPAFEQRMGTAAMLMDGSEAEGIYGTAKGIYVAEMRKSGKSPDDFDQGAWNAAMHRALGGKYDGQNWYGGVWTWGKNSVLISPTVTGKQFEGAMTKLGSAVQWRKGAAPVYSNGTPIPPGELVRKFTPVMRPDGWYEFVDPSGNPVPAANGKAFLIDIEATARKYPK